MYGDISMSNRIFSFFEVELDSFRVLLPHYGQALMEGEIGA